MSRDTHRKGEEISKAPSPMVNEELQTVKVTLTGGATHTVDLVSVGLHAMENASYRAAVHGEFAGTVRVDESTITAAGFNIIGGDAGGAEIAHVWIHGKTQKRI